MLVIGEPVNLYCMQQWQVWPASHSMLTQSCTSEEKHALP